MQVHTKFGVVALSILSLSIGTAGAVRALDDTVTVSPTPAWASTGVKTSNGKFFSKFFPNAPKTFGVPSVVVFGNALTGGLLTGSGSFSSTPVNIDFTVSNVLGTNSFTADGVIKGTVGYKSGVPFSTASVTFTKLTDTTTGATDAVSTDPANSLPALFLKTSLGGVYIDQKQSIAAPGQTTSVSGFISSIPEMNTALGLGCMLLSGGLLGRLRFKRR